MNESIFLYCTGIRPRHMSVALEVYTLAARPACGRRVCGGVPGERDVDGKSAAGLGVCGDGGVVGGDDGPTSPQFQAALHACHHVLPAGVHLRLHMSVGVQKP